MMKTVVIVIFGLFMAFMAFGFIGRANDPLADAKDSARDAINLCQKNQDDVLMPLDQRRFIRNVCDKMRSDYQTKYGSAP
jgi:hypothetical protein